MRVRTIVGMSVGVVVVVVAAIAVFVLVPIFEDNDPFKMSYDANCASCHGGLQDGKPQRDVMAGGLVMESPIGAFHVPNISPDPDQGIGGWSDLDFLNAMQRGLAPDGGAGAKHHRVEVPRRCRVVTVFSGRRSRDVVPLLFQPLLQAGQQLFLVLDEEHFCHGIRLHTDPA